MKKITYQLRILIAVVVILSLCVFPIHADEVEEIGKQINDLRSLLESSQKATKNNENAAGALKEKLNIIKQKVQGVEQAINARAIEIENGTEELEKQKTRIGAQSLIHYKQMGNQTLDLTSLLLFGNISESLSSIFYLQKGITETRNSIIQTVTFVKGKEDAKTKLEKEKQSLAGIKDQLANQEAFLSGEVEKAKKNEGEISRKIGELSAKQQSILAARGGGFTATIGDSDEADDYNASIKGFKELAPGGYFAVFAFGAHTHRKGMSQYGARGRAQSGQDAKTILKAYYGKEPVGKDTGGSIRVSGYGEMDFEGKYLYGIAEMPSSWHPEALKAQAIAARTYAYRYKVDGKEICTTEACQVYNDGKANNTPESWKKAVDDTRGQVLEDVVTYYASTHGGYASPIGWDTTDGGGGGSFIDKAYDKLGGSPWLYKAWYTKGYSVSSDKCGRGNPWLSPEEMADIVNAAIALRTEGIDTSRISPITSSCWNENSYSMSELHDLVSGKGGISSASSATVVQGNGTTSSVTINGVSLSGAEFKKAFNLRAPGYMAIPQSGFAFFNIEHK